MVQTNLIRDLQNRGVAVQNGDAQHTYNSLCMNDAIKMEVERSQLMYKHDMVDSMLSQLANIDQDTNLPLNSYDIDLPMWMTMDQGDPFADVELGSDLSNLRDRFFPADAANNHSMNRLGGGLGGGPVLDNPMLADGTAASVVASAGVATATGSPDAPSMTAGIATATGAAGGGVAASGRFQFVLGAAGCGSSPLRWRRSSIFFATNARTDTVSPSAAAAASSSIAAGSTTVGDARRK